MYNRWSVNLVTLWINSSSRTSTLNKFNKNFIRLYCPRNVKNLNVGINRMLKINDNKLEEIIEDPDKFHDLESDFMNIHESHEDYKKEMDRHKKNIRLWIIKNKYFKNKQPNFLTYYEKQQIKMLHQKDPDEWTFEKLSESFPAEIETIKKVAKSNWRAISKEKIIKHDEAVIKNWNLYKEGKLSNVISNTLKEILDKFTERKAEDIKNMNIDDIEFKTSLPTPQITEFSKIITSCKKYQNEKNKSENFIENLEYEKQLITSGNSDENKNLLYENLKSKHKQNCTEEDKTFLINKLFDKRYMRLKDIKKIKNLTQNDESNYEEEHLSKPNPIEIFDENENSNEENKNQIKNLNNNLDNLMKIEKFEKNEVEIEINKEIMKKYDVTPIKEKIHILRKLWKKNATYKVEDCYYDYDGEFLYRVPGMIGARNMNKKK